MFLSWYCLARKQILFFVPSALEALYFLLTEKIVIKRILKNVQIIEPN